MKRTSNNYIETYTGKEFYVLDPRPEDISIVDIAHALSMICRYTGHSNTFYSVAEHSYHISQLCSPENRLWGLLHDASEAYLADIASPVKPFLHNYREMEETIMKTICDKFGLPHEMPEEVHYYDMEMLRVESYHLMNSRGLNWAVNKNNPSPRVMETIPCMAQERAKLLFLEQFELLTNG